MNPRRLIERAYDQMHWSHGPHWVIHDRELEDWYGFPNLRIWEDREPEIRLIPLPRHTYGHCGLAIRVDAVWLLHCGDAVASTHPETDIHGLDPRKYTAKVLPGWFARHFLGGHAAKLRNLLKNHGDEIEAISSHDVYSFVKHSKSEK